MEIRVFIFKWNLWIEAIGLVRKMKEVTCEDYFTKCIGWIKNVFYLHMKLTKWSIGGNKNQAQEKQTSKKQKKPLYIYHKVTMVILLLFFSYMTHQEESRSCTLAIISIAPSSSTKVWVKESMWLFHCNLWTSG